MESAQFLHFQSSCSLTVFFSNGALPSGQQPAGEAEANPEMGDSCSSKSQFFCLSFAFSLLNLSLYSEPH